MWQRRSFKFPRECDVNSEVNTEFTMFCSVQDRSSEAGLTCLWGHAFTPGCTPWPLRLYWPSFLPSKSAALLTTGPLHMLSFLSQILFHSLISLKKCLQRVKYLTGAGAVLTNKARLWTTKELAFLSQLWPLSATWAPAFPSDLSPVTSSSVKFSQSPWLDLFPLLCLFLHSANIYGVPPGCCTLFLTLEIGQWREMKTLALMLTFWWENKVIFFFK